MTEVEATWERLPDECVHAVVLSLTTDDYHMLTLPLVCKCLRRVCQHPYIEAARLASRLRQVVNILGSDLCEDSWALGHAWGALAATDQFLSDDNGTDRLKWLQATARGELSLRALCRHCAQLHLPTLAPSTAEDLFLEDQTSARKASLTVHTRQHALHSGDRAASKAGAAIGINYSGSQVAVYQEAQLQAQRHLAASCRRNWKMLSAPMRRSWERKAAQANDRQERKHAAVRTTTALARALIDQLEAPKPTDTASSSPSMAKEVGDAHGINDRASKSANPNLSIGDVSSWAQLTARLDTRLT